MAKVEVDEEELRANRQLRQVVSNILSNPKAKVLVQQAQKMVDPNAITPELDAQAQINEPVAEVNKKLEALQKQLAEKDAEAEKKAKLADLEGGIEKGLSKLRSSGWTDDGVAGVRKIMEEKGILDPEIAAAYFEKLHPPQTPVAPSGSGAWNFMDITSDEAGDLKKLVESKGENVQLLDKMAHDALNEIRGQTRR